MTRMADAEKQGAAALKLSCLSNTWAAEWHTQGTPAADRGTREASPAEQPGRRAKPADVLARRRLDSLVAAGAGLMQGLPDGTEEACLQELEAEVEQHAAALKQVKAQNCQARAQQHACCVSCSCPSR